MRNYTYLNRKVSMREQSPSLEGTSEKSGSSSSSDSESDSPFTKDPRSPKSDEIDAYNRIASYFKQNRPYHILAIMAQLRNVAAVPPSTHFILGMTLFKLGRTAGALREMGLSIELQSDPEAREYRIRQLTSFFERLGMKDRALSCFGEVIAMAREKELLLGEQQNYSELERQLEVIMDKPEELDPNVAEHVALPIHLQAMEYLKENLEFSENSFNRNVLAVQTLLLNSNNILESSDKLKPDPLDPLFEAILYIGPNYLFHQFNGETVKKHLELKLAKHPEIDYNIHPKKLVRQLQVWSRSDHSPAIRRLCELIIKHKFVLGYFNFYEKEYDSAIDTFLWVEKFIGRALLKLPFIEDSNKILSPVCQRVALIYTCQSYCYKITEIQHSESAMDVYRKLAVMEFSESHEYSAGRLSKFFLACGMVFEQVSSKKGTKILIEKGEKMTEAYRYEEVSLMEMLRHYISATVSTLPDDPTTPFIYDRIIWGILMHGGLHLKVLWLFIILKNYFFIEVDYCPTHLHPGSDYRVFKNNDILGKYENGWEVVYKGWDLCTELKLTRKDNPWSSKHQNTYLIPRLLEQGSRILMVEEAYEVTDDVTYMYASKYSVSKKRKSCLKKNIDENAYENNLKQSKSLIRLWFNSYREHHGKTPEIVDSFWDELE